MQMSRWHEEDEEPLEEEIPRIRMNPKNPTSRERNKNMKIQEMLSAGNGVLLLSKVEVLVDNIDRIILKCDDEPSTKAVQDAVIHAFGVEVIPPGPPEGAHMASGRVEMAVREVKRQCRTLRISGEPNTSVRIADDSPLLSWLPRFAAQIMNKMRIGKD